MVQIKIKSYAKINLALNIIGKKSSLHRIETLVSFISLHDEIFIKKIKSNNHKVSFVGKFSKNITKDNTISRLLDVLQKKRILKNKKFKIKINKKIPSQAGLGGGSMNAASILKYFLKKKLIKMSKREIISISKLIGSDVILGLVSTHSILNSKNEIKRFKNYKKFYTLIVKPNFGCSTKTVYLGVKKFTKPRFNIPKKNMFSLRFLLKQENALEKISFLKYPKLQTIKSFLESLNKPLFVRMTGSGSVLVAYYQKKQDCDSAKVQFKRKFKDYWCITSKTI